MTFHQIGVRILTSDWDVGGLFLIQIHPPWTGCAATWDEAVRGQGEADSGLRTHAVGTAALPTKTGQACEAVWSFQQAATRSSEACWLNTVPVSRSCETGWNLLEHDPVSRSGRAVYVFGPAVETVRDAVLFFVDGEPAEVLGLDIDTVDASYETRPGHTEVLVLDKNFAAEPDLVIEEEDVGANEKILVVRTHPFTEIALRTSGDPESVSVEDLGVFEEEREELVEMVLGRGSVSTFATELLGWTWRYADLGDLALERTELASAQAGQSLAEVRFRVRGQRFRVRSERLEKVQFFGEI